MSKLPDMTKNKLILTDFDPQHNWYCRSSIVRRNDKFVKDGIANFIAGI